MEFNLKYSNKNILLLGAGASVDYGLPVWNDLSSLIRKEIGKDGQNSYRYNKEILDWMDKVGDNKEYKTIDECIKKESKYYHSNGHNIENQLFLIIKEIFAKTYKSNKGWIRRLNEKILQNPSLAHEIVFINYNYDDVLDKNFLDFKYLSAKERIMNDRETLKKLSEIKAAALYPHGHFDYQRLSSNSQIIDYHHTMKSDLDGYEDVVSCYESEPHSVVPSSYFNEPRKINLYILGLGGGLQVNLNNIDFKTEEISEIHVTIKDSNKNYEVKSFLSDKYKIPLAEIKVYTTCEELIEKAF